MPRSQLSTQRCSTAAVAGPCEACNAALLLAEGIVKKPCGERKGGAAGRCGWLGAFGDATQPLSPKVSGPSTLTPHGLRGVSADRLWVTHTRFDLPAPAAKGQRIVCLKQIIEFPHQEGPPESTDEWPPSLGMENSLPAKPQHHSFSRVKTCFLPTSTSKPALTSGGHSEPLPPPSLCLEAAGGVEGDSGFSSGK